ncbi:MAG: pyrimidine dimer DNA glycosylase/endonuclease V [Spirochaetota bacterium]
MRLWSVHPEYLDMKGLTAAWREGLLAQKVLENRTAGYRNHPQLIRFKKADDPVHAIGLYLLEIHREAVRRGYRFDALKIHCFEERKAVPIPVNRGQVLYEFELLKYKMDTRDVLKRKDLSGVREIKVNPAFKMVSGEIEEWEKTIPEILCRVPG